MKKIIKSIYNIIPFKKEMFSFLKLFYSPPESVFQHLHFKGLFTVPLENGKKFRIYHHGYIAENEIFWKGISNGWEKKSLALWMELCKNAHTILDIGANSGIYALVAKTINTNSTVHCFEPIPGVYDILKQNIRVNEFHILTHCVALSDHSGKAKIYLKENSDFAYSVTVNKNTVTDVNAKEIEIDICDLASFIEVNKITGIDLMKIDVETHEPEVLRGMGTYLQKYKPTMLIEILNNDTAEQLSEIVNGMNYVYYNIDDPKGTIRKVDKLTASDYWNFLICSPEVAKTLSLE